MMIDALGSPSALRPAPPAAEPAFLGNVAQAPASPGPQPADFTAMLTGMFSDAASAVKAAEATSIAAVQGKASVQQVAEAVLAAEMTLQSAIAVRDRVTAAYLELSRMSI
jgi:flagellar hook-basal body complex protein FliE